ncbi:hypothetical protein [Rhodococcus qingshengii]|uniref:hypothetical protein n=1 Tax=Rhodococcus qingshengii TaxID=334542 RepID=UPI0013151E7E|nr:hypothetical protein [Rhodococcus qingshengii]
MHISLSDAVHRFKQESDAPSNAYDWYRKYASLDGKVWLGNHRVAVIKLGRRWMVEETDLEDAIIEHRKERAKVHQMTSDYHSRILHPGTMQTNDGGYQIRGDFHFLWNDMAGAQHRSDGFWRCNKCWDPAATEHNREECHRCSDWSPCNDDCTLSRIYCPSCDTSEVM